MTAYLRSLDISSGAERLYRQILRGAPIGVPELAEQLGWDLATLRHAVVPLLDLGLVAETDDGVLLADDPRATIGRLLEGELGEVRRRQGELERARNAIAHFVADHDTARRGARRPTWEVVPADLMHGVVLESIRSTTGAIRSSAITADWSPDGIDQVLQQSRATITSGREMRSLYPMTALSSPSARIWMSRFAAVGEKQRLVRDPLSEFVVFGQDLVIATTEWASVQADYVKVRDPMLVQTFRHLFELAWAAGMPPPDESADDADDRRLLTLLAAGHKDEAIARHLGVSLRTVRRRVATLMDELGVSTRFQLGMAVARQPRQR
ncbi:helix-turn-helix domain-containing protein [Arsenicicoccus dermatophilus]|uniref:helix-turn-helix transcriptional regulator n=1 Tax=Arsenicicoccus dermatophilus TaxID=1076331 RepID=UPI0039173890